MLELAEKGEREGLEELWGILGYEPYPENVPILESGKRFIIVAGGEQSSKSTTAGVYWSQKWFEDQEKWPSEGDGRGNPLLYWLIGASYGETIKEFVYIQDHLTSLGMPVRATKRVDPGQIEVRFPDEARPRVRIETKSGTDIRKMSKDAPHGIIICEPGQVDLVVFERAQGRLTPKNGWLFMPGTFEDSLGWFPQLWQAWQSGADDRQSFSLPTWANKALYPGGRNDPKILELERHSSDSFFMERIAGRPVPPKGLVFHEFRADLHVRDLHYMPGETVYLFEDPGYGGEHNHAVEICHIIDGQVRVFDEIYENKLLTEEIIQLLMRKSWWYREEKVVVSDPNYKTQHHSTTSVEDIWLKETGIRPRGTKLRINEGTERLKSFLKPDPIMREPKIVFSPHCKGVLSEFGAVVNPLDGQAKPYSWKTDREGNTIGEVPDDRYNDGIKAIIYGIWELFGPGHTNTKLIQVTRW